MNSSRADIAGIYKNEREMVSLIAKEMLTDFVRQKKQSILDTEFVYEGFLKQSKLA